MLLALCLGLLSPDASAAGAAPKPAGKVYVVTIDKLAFGAAPKGLHAGDVIEWVNRDIFEHTATARGTLGDGPLLLPEQTVILTDSLDEARAIGTDWLRSYLALPNYANNLLRSGFSEEDLSQVSDRLFNAIIAWGNEDAILRRVSEHRSAGANHVCIQVLLSDPRAYPREQWRRIAAALT